MILGAIVVYHMTETDQTLHNGNNQEKLPAVVVAKWGEEEKCTVNLKVFTDSKSADIWKTSVMYGDEPGKYTFQE